MRKLILGTFFIATSILSFAQGTYDDLKILYADGNYEKLVRESEKYTQKDETKKDPLPYIWMSRGLYKISISGNTDDAYKNAYKDALGAYSKFLKYDEGGALLADDDNLEHHNLMQRTLVERIENEVSTENYRKAFSWTIKYKKISNNVIGEMYMEGACKFRNQDKSSAFTLWRDAEKMVEETTSIEDWSESDIKILKMGVLQSAECWVSVRQPEKAKALLNKVAPWFEDDADFKASYDEIVN